MFFRRYRPMVKLRKVYKQNWTTISFDVNMGRIKTALIKRVTNKLVDQKGSELKTDFTDNKKLVSNFAVIRSKKIRNIIAGYTTRLMKAKQ
jgi:small subunit ribosomal protein S17e